MRGKQNGDFSASNFRWFLFGMCSDVPMVKNLFLLFTSKFWIGVNGYCNTHAKSDFAQSFDVRWLTNFAKGIDLLCNSSFWFVPSCKHPIYTIKCDQWIPLWWAKFELECLLIMFIHFNSNFKALAKMGTLNAGV